MQMSIVIMLNSVRVLQKLKNGTAMLSSKLTNRYRYKWNEVSLLKRDFHSCVYYSSIHNKKEIESTYPATDQWMGKETVVYLHNAIQFKRRN
jgi:hypothetical protein